MQHNPFETEESQARIIAEPAPSNIIQSFETPIEVYTAYAHPDKRYFSLIKERLEILRRQGWPIFLPESEITSSTEWQRSDHLATAHLILLLVSTTFLNSDFCYSHQMYLAVERHRNSSLCYVIPILLHPLLPSLLMGTPFGGLDFLPTNGRPISTWKNSREAYNDIIGYLMEKIQVLNLYVSTPWKKVSSPLEFYGGISQKKIPNPMKSRELQLPLLALAYIALEEDDQALVGRDYTILAGIETKDINRTDRLSKRLSFDISLLVSDNIQIASEWHNQLQFELDYSRPQFIPFSIKVLAPGRSSLTLNFYNKELWLKTIRFTFNAVEKVLLTSTVEKG